MSAHESALESLVGYPRVTHEQDNLEWQGGASEPYVASNLPGRQKTRTDSILMSLSRLVYTKTEICGDTDESVTVKCIQPHTRAFVACRFW